MLLLYGSCIAIAAVGIFELRRHQKRVEQIPLRVNVNGVRGKSTVTRLITGMLSEADYKVVGKTTGTQARTIYWDRTEKPIERSLEGPNIREQKEILKHASSLEANAFVSECMAINPDYQRVLQEKFLQANVSVILNVFEDHMETLGPTLKYVAEAFSSTIPYNGKLILSNGPYFHYFSEIAEKRNTEVYLANPEEIPDGFIDKFDYMLFPENIAAALAVARAVDIDKRTALSGMLNANPDPGALRIVTLEDGSRERSHFVNGFAANDARSTLEIWSRVRSSSYMTDNPVIIMNCREDRVDRTEEFTKYVLPYLPAEKLILIGGNVRPITQAFDQGELPFNSVINLEGEDADAILARVKREASHSLIFGIGNIHGAAEEFMEKLYDSPETLISKVGEEAM
ncbi:poly-gamma-glutamate synthase PgsB [Marinococcus luteus]|uniref:poly-gamma-glutamate synthase PgsB n=1 Tax=Marinococcus luteus TaxID=1122204 RepID=UPI002ACC6DA9|nr:poly-gamma-glutamate synthase PgsB [Marinococcus luteus]MDZ5782226.1 poly-gamma-glutamate synthase PgsB [Marinococcus luteus]